MGDPTGFIEAKVNPYGDGWPLMGSGMGEAAAKDEAIVAWNRFDMERY